MKFNAITAEIFGAEDDLGVERVMQQTVRDVVLPDGPPSGTDTHLADAEFVKFVSGADDVVDDCGFPVLMQKSAPTLTLPQRAAQAISKSVNAVFPRVEFITKSASGRTAKIAEILDQTKQALSAKGYKPDGWDGWKALAKHADEFVISVLMEA
jgi:hypothetical protein